jgi:hopanoid C-3 methylase
VALIAARLALKGQTNFFRMLWTFNNVYNAERQYADHFREARYRMRPPSFQSNGRRLAQALYVHNPRGQTDGAQPKQMSRTEVEPAVRAIDN